MKHRIHAVSWQNDPLCRCHQREKENHLCYGGAARLYSKVMELRKNNSGHTLLLNAGDYYQGTIWYTIFKYEPIVVLANMLNYTAFSLGNHDFDDGVEGLVPFLQQVNFPVLSANIKVSKVFNSITNWVWNCICKVQIKEIKMILM